MFSSPPWSISIICKNEESALPTLLNSSKLQEFIKLGGEIVVVDTGSTDKTIDILEQHNFKLNDDSRPNLRYELAGDKFTFCIDEDMAREIHNKYLVPGDEPFVEIGKKIFNFGEARKYAGRQCSNDWVLSLDCDEIPVNMDINFLNHIVQTGDVDQIVFHFRYMGSNGNVQSTTSRDKFYNRNVADWRWVVHEQVMTLPGKSMRSVTVTENTLALDHYQHPAEHRSNYLVQMCIDVMKDPNDRHVHWLGRELYFSGRYRSAIRLLKSYLIDYESAWRGEKCFSSIYIGSCYIDLAKKEMSKELSTVANNSNSEISRAVASAFENYKDRKRRSDKLVQKGLNWYFRATIFEPNFREPWIKMADYYKNDHDYSHAVQYATVSLVVPSTLPLNYMNDSSCYKDKPFAIIYQSMLILGNKIKAQEAWKIALHIDPANEKYIADGTLFNQMENVTPPLSSQMEKTTTSPLISSPNKIVVGTSRPLEENKIENNEKVSKIALKDIIF